MKIRQSTIDDLKRLMHIYGYARTLMAANGNANQWINGYPSEDLIRQEIANGHSWVCLDENGIIVGTFCLIEGEDPSYAYIEDGKWLNTLPYVTVHRLATSGEKRGVADACFQWCFERYANVRVDTHRDNIIMQNILKKYGFVYCGIIYVANGTPRLAFQRYSKEL